MNPQPAGVKRRKAALKPEHKDSDSATLSPSFFLRFPDVADTIAENVFASGLKAAQNLALSSRGMWAAVALKAVSVTSLPHESRKRRRKTNLV